MLIAWLARVEFCLCLFSRIIINHEIQWGAVGVEFVSAKEGVIGIRRITLLGHYFLRD